MKQIKVQPNQTVYDLAVQYYGTCEAVATILADNPTLVNDPAALVSLGVNTVVDTVFRLDVAIKPDSVVYIDTASKLMDYKTLKKIDNNEITTYETWQEQ